MIVHSSSPLVLVGGADLGPLDVNILQRYGANTVAVDAGADHLLGCGVVPRAVIGDLDSLSQAARDAFADRLHHVPEQETVDFEKAVLRVAAPVIIAVGFSGGRLDHMLAGLDVMGRHHVGVRQPVECSSRRGCACHGIGAGVDDHAARYAVGCM